jgi:hypothetical protein
MKRWLVLPMILLAFGLEAQSFVDCPTAMRADTLAARAWAKYDTYLNGLNTSNATTYVGPVDLDFYVSCASATETVTLTAWGLKRKLIAGTWTLCASADSVSVASITASATPTLYSYAIDALWTSFKTYDGIRLSVKVAAADPTCTFKFNYRVWPQGKSDYMR